jgi:hypothetical protein
VASKPDQAIPLANGGIYTASALAATPNSAHLLCFTSPCVPSRYGPRNLGVEAKTSHCVDYASSCTYRPTLLVSTRMKEAFSKVKGLLRKAEARSPEILIEADDARGEGEAQG